MWLHVKDMSLHVGGVAACQRHVLACGRCGCMSSLHAADMFLQVICLCVCVFVGYFWRLVQCGRDETDQVL